MNYVSPEALAKKVLTASFISMLIISIAGFVVSLLSSSHAIFFDGATNLLGGTITLLSLAVIKFIEKPDNARYPFGKEALEPFFASVQFVIVLAVSIGIIVSSVLIILSGGREIDTTQGVLFGILSTMFKVGVLLFLKSLAKKNTTPITETEIVGWKMEVFIGANIFAGFSVSYILGKTPLASFTPFVDPALTIIIGLIFTLIAITAIKNYIGELLLKKPSAKIINMVMEKIESVKAACSISENITDSIFRISKSGGKVIVELDYVVAKDSKLENVSEQDLLRQHFSSALAALPYRVWLNISYTGNAVFTNHIVKGI